MGRRAFGWFVAAWLFGSSSVLAQPLALTPSDIDAAIKWGEDGQASPYVLHHAAQPGTTSDVVVGAVYTPFVRVALAAKTLSDGGRHLTTEEVPPALLEPVAYIAFRWYCCDDVHGDQWAWHPLDPFDYHVAFPGNPPGLRGIQARPLWVTADLSALEPFGGVPYPDVVLVAGYPISALLQPSDFVIYRNVPNPASPEHPGVFGEIGRVTAADVQRWR